MKLDVVADQHAASLERLVPRESELATVDLRVGAEAEALAAPRIDARSFVLCPGSAYDRSPCGTGTSAVLACEHAAGRLAVGQV